MTTAHIARLLLTAVVSTALLTACQANGDKPVPNAQPAKSIEYPTFGKITAHDPAFDKLVPPGSKLEKLAEGFDWSEGPIWISAKVAVLQGKPGPYLLFSDVPKNIVHQWKPGESKATEFLKPSGYTGTTPRGGEPGSNGLTLDSQGRLVLCEHGDRRVARLNPDGSKTTLADKWEGKRFNSPNDVIFHSNGDLYFTDPPYGLVKNVDDPAKEIPFQGVYRVGKDGTVTLLTKEVTRPNGIAFSPDEKTLYVASSDPDKAVWWAFPMKEDGTIGEGKILFDATTWFKEKKWKGLPDGLKIDSQGNLWATGPGGVQVFSPEGKHLGQIDTGEATANVAWGEDGSTLYITADMYVARLKTNAKAATMPGPK